MANSKSKKATAKKKSSAKKSNNASAKSTKVEKVEEELEATTNLNDEEIVDETEEVEVEEEEVVEIEEDEDEDEKTTVTIVSTEEQDKPFKGFFKRKSDPKENILTIFKSPRIYGAILGEAIGTMLLTMLLLTLGFYQPLYIMFGLIAITVAVCAISGANLNPIVTAGMMATRRVSAIRGILYIIAQVIGAWIGLMIVNAFASGSESASLPVMAAVEDGKFWVITLIEFLGATIIGYFFARALSYKRNALTFAAVVGGGTAFAILIAIVISGNFLGLQNNFALNPAVAIMYQILPTSGDSFGALFGDIMLALVTYVIFPMLGGIVGFFIADISGRLAGEKTHHDCGSCCHHHSTED